MHPRRGLVAIALFLVSATSACDRSRDDVSAGPSEIKLSSGTAKVACPLIKELDGLLGDPTAWDDGGAEDVRRIATGLREAASSDGGASFAAKAAQSQLRAVAAGAYVVAIEIRTDGDVEHAVARTKKSVDRLRGNCE